jgi:hypothetical protein
MRLLRALAILAAVVLAGFLVPAPAQAGGWAATVLDPLPERLKPGTPYTVGMWVLQHGSHPFEGKLGPVSLTLTGDQGTLTFPAVALIEPAHYAAAIVAPRHGVYKVVAMQGFFAPYDVGTLTVPGGFAATAMPPPVPFEDAEKNWPGPVRPPVVTVDPNRNPYTSDVAPAVKAPVPAADPVAAATPAEPASRTPLVAAAAVVVAGLAFLLTKRQRQGRSAQRSGPSPSSSSMTWIAASSADAPPPSMPASQATESASTSSPKPSSSSTSRPARGSVS